MHYNQRFHLAALSLCDYRLSMIDELFYNLLNQNIIRKHDVSEFDYDFTYFYRTELSKLIKTLRHAKSFINSLITSLPPIAGEVNLLDFVLLEFIKVFQVEIYNDIYENWWFYVDQRTDNDWFVNPFSIALEDGNFKKNEAIKEHIDNILNGKNNDIIARNVFLEILKKLFPNIHEAYKQ